MRPRLARCATWPLAALARGLRKRRRRDERRSETTAAMTTGPTTSGATLRRRPVRPQPQVGRLRRRPAGARPSRAATMATPAATVRPRPRSTSGQRSPNRFRLRLVLRKSAPLSPIRRSYATTTAAYQARGEPIAKRRDAATPRDVDAGSPGRGYGVRDRITTLRSYRAARVVVDTGSDS
jgi:hypothetical protein